MGKTLAEARAEVEKCAFTCAWFAGARRRVPRRPAVPERQPAQLRGLRTTGHRVRRHAVELPAVAGVPIRGAGAVRGQLRASSSTRPTSAAARWPSASSSRTPAVPRGVFAVLLVPNDRVAAIIEDRRIAAVTLTGSTAAGRSVGAAAGRTLKPAVLELGGSDAFIVLEDADLEAAAATAAKARFQNAGQSCIAAKRFIVVDAVAAEFEERLVAEARKVVVGDPLRESVTMGPLARGDLRDTLERQLRESVAAGATLRCGGDRHGGPRLLHHARGADRVHRGDARVPGGDVRPPGRGDARRLGRRGALRCQQLRLRPGRQHLDTRRGAWGCAGTAHGERRRVHQRHDPFGCAHPLRRHQGERATGGSSSSFGIREFVNVKTIWRPAARRVARRRRPRRNEPPAANLTYPVDSSAPVSGDAAILGQA